MKNLVVYEINKSKKKDICQHLNACDFSFVPALSERVSIDNYSKKLCENAMRFEAWHNKELVGLIALYCVLSDVKSAYITNFSILPSFQGKGVASSLANYCFDFLYFKSFEYIRLEVNKKNKIAIDFYHKTGFYIYFENELALEMRVYLKGYKV